MGVTAVTDRHIRLTAALQIDGLETVFYLGNAEPSAGALTAIGGTDQAWARGLQSIGATAASLALKEGVPDSSSITCRVLIQAGNNARDLLRRSPSGASASSTLETTLPGEQNTGALTVQAVDPITAFPASGFIWIGQEALEYDAKNDGARTFNIPIGNRGKLGTKVQLHIADPERSRAPRIYADCCTWRRRSARVWVGQLDSSGDWIDAPVVEAEGFISGIPQRDQDGGIEVQIETLPSVLDGEFGGAQVETKLQAGWHLFDGTNANRFDAFTEIWTQGAAYDEQAQAALALGASPLTAPVGAIPQLFKSNDPEVMGLVLRNTPAAGIMPVNSAGTVTGANGVDDPTGTVGLIGGAVQAVNINDRVVNSRLEFVSAYTFGTPGSAQVVQWPAAIDGLTGELQNAVTAATPGPWAAVTIGADGTMTVSPQWDTPTPRPLLLRWLQPEASTCWGLCPGSELPALTEAGIDPGDWPAFDPRPRAERRRNPRPSPAQEPEVDLEAGDEQVYTLTVPDAWYQPPERYMLVADSVASGASSGDPKWFIAKHQRDGSEVRSAYRAIGEVAASSITATAPGFAVEIHPDDRQGPAVAALAGSEPPVIRPVAAWRDASTATIIRQALGSYTGTGAIGADDVQPYGLGVPTALIDSASFDALEVDALGPRSHLFDEAADSRDIISALCRSVGAVLTERLDQATGRRLLSLEPVGLPTPQQSVQTIGTGDWLTDGRPVVVTDADIVTRIDFGMQWGDPLQTISVADEDRGEFTVTVVDSDSEGEHGAPESEELRLYGIRADSDDPRVLQDVVLPIAQARFAAYGYPRNTIQGVVPYSIGVTLYPGAVVTISAAELDGYNGQPLASTPALVTSVERDAMAQRATVRAVYWAANAAGWAPALQVTSATGYSAGTPVPVTANHYQPSASPSGAAQVDVDAFAVGDAVRFVPRGDYASAVTANVTAIDRATPTITLDANVPASAGTIRPQDYTAVSSTLQGFAFCADSTDLQQSNGDAAKVYS